MIPVYVIHLPNTGRKAKIAAELARVGFTDITYVHAQEPVQGFQMSNMRRNPRGEFGCSLSHLKALNKAYAEWFPDRGLGYALIVEDDVVFVDDALDKLLSAIDYLDWNVNEFDILYLGGHPREPLIPVEGTKTLYKVGRFSCAEAYAVDLGSVPYIIDFWCDRAGQPNAMFDFILGEYAAQGGGYAFYPTLTHQPVGWSHIGQKVDDKSAVIEKGWRTHLCAD